MNTSTIQRTISNLCVFCGSSAGNDTAYTDAAKALACEMATRSIHLVYGGGGAGIMGTLASALRDTGVRVTGIIPERLYEMVKHLDHTEDELVVVHTMHERKAAMYDRSDAFVALPGGIGTLEELMEALTWLQLGYHAKPIGILNSNGFFDSLISLLRRMVDDGFLGHRVFGTLVVEKNPAVLLDRLAEVELVIPQKIVR
jgi:hypothetical protein